MGNTAERRDSKQKHDTAAGHPAADDVRLDDIIELGKFAERYPDLAGESRLRWWIFHREENGIEKAGAVVKHLGRWYCVPQRMRDWLLRGDSA